MPLPEWIKDWLDKEGLVEQEAEEREESSSPHANAIDAEQWGVVPDIEITSQDVLEHSIFDAEMQARTNERVRQYLEERDFLADLLSFEEEQRRLHREAILAQWTANAAAWAISPWIDARRNPSRPNDPRDSIGE